MFLDLNGSRPSGMGVSGIPLTEIEAWCRLRRITLTDWELDTLIGMDNVVLSAWAAAKQNAASERPKQ